MQLAQVPIHKEAIIQKITAYHKQKIRMMEMGFMEGTKVRIKNKAPMHGPISIQLRSYTVTLRYHEASNVLVEVL